MRLLTLILILGILTTCATQKVSSMARLRYKLEKGEFRKKIYLIDSGITLKQTKHISVCKYPDSVRSVFKGDKGITELLHGEAMMRGILEALDVTKYCIVSVKVFSKKEFTDDIKYNHALNIAMADKLTVGINLSVASRSNSEVNFSKRELGIITAALFKGIRIQVAAGNEGFKLHRDNCHVYPACLAYKFKGKFADRFTVVSRWDSDERNSFKDLEVAEQRGKDYYGEGSGTSMATARYTGEIFSK